MKALLIADNSTVIDNISSVLETAGYDVIVYKWLIKALDNIEEIAPHLIVVSTKDYPRHWKTLTQFSTTAFSAYKPAVVLYADGGLDDEENRKAKALGVRGVFDNVGVEGLEELRSILVKEADIYSGKLIDENGKEVKTEKPELTAAPVAENISAAVEVQKSSVEEEVPTVNDIAVIEEPVEEAPVVEESFPEAEDAPVPEENAEDAADEPAVDETIEVEEEPAPVIESAVDVPETPVAEEIVEQSVPVEEEDISVQYISFMFTNPVSGALVTGYASNYDGKTFEFRSDIDDFTKDLHSGVQIQWGSVKINDSFKSVSATVKSNEDVLVLELN